MKSQTNVQGNSAFRGHLRAERYKVTAGGRCDVVYVVMPSHAAAPGAINVLMPNPPAVVLSSIAFWERHMPVGPAAPQTSARCNVALSNTPPQAKTERGGGVAGRKAWVGCRRRPDP
eukprot:gene11156-biopygen1809